MTHEKSNNNYNEEFRQLYNEICGCFPEDSDNPKQGNDASQSCQASNVPATETTCASASVKAPAPSEMNTSELLIELAELREGNYDAIRERYMEINAEISARGQTPPSLRGLRRPRPVGKRGPEDEQLMHDLQVIDLNWLHAKHRDVYADPLIEGKLARAFARLCKREKFAPELAVEIAETGSTKEKKCDALGITEVHQPELSNLRTDEVREAQYSFLSRYQKARGNIRARALGYKYGRMHADTWATAWGAAEWLKLTGRKLSPKQLAEAYFALGGAEIKPASAVKKLISVRKLLGEQLEAQLESYCTTPAKQPASSQNVGTP